MKVAITGGAGFVGHHLAERLLAEGHSVVLISRHAGKAPLSERAIHVASDLSNAIVLTAAFQGCEAVAHCAGINRELGAQTFRRVHRDGTRNVATAAQSAGVRRIALMSFLRARPSCGSPYHESKFIAEEIGRNSGLEYTVVKAGMVYGRGDHMLHHLSRSLFTFPIVATVGWRAKPIRPLPIEDLIQVLPAALVERLLARKTIAVTGTDQLYLRDAVLQIAEVLGRKVWIVPAPIMFHRVLAQVCEWTMKVPLVAKRKCGYCGRALLRRQERPIFCRQSCCPSDTLQQSRFGVDYRRPGHLACGISGAGGNSDVLCVRDRRIGAFASFALTI